jgi:hypothetical protein
MKTTLIRATSRVSTKLKDNFYTFEYSEERSIDEGDDLEQAREELWNTCNAEVDAQVEETVALVNNRR